MCFSACLPQPPDGSEASIFKRPTPGRYGWGATGRRPGSEAKPAPKPQQQKRANNNSFGYTENKKKPESGSPPGDSGSPDGSNSGPGPIPDNASNPAGTAPNNSSGDGSGDNMVDGGSSSPSGGGSSTPSAPPSNLNEYPYARLVPGKKGYVTLPGANASVGEIEVTGIKPGTPVEINDPRDPSKKIYFRVP